MMRPIRKLPLATIALFFVASSSAYAQSVTSGTAEVNGSKLYYEVAGKGPVVILIHGGLCDRRVWDDQFRAFSKRFRVIRYDLRGFGKSEFSYGPYSHVDDLYALLRYLKIKRASLVGLSLGGLISADLAISHPEMVSKLVLTSSGLRGDESPRHPRSTAIEKIAEEKGMNAAITAWLEHPFFASGTNNKDYVRRTRQMLTDNYRYWGPTPKVIQVTWPQPPTIERLNEIRVPTLIIVGARDADNILSIAETLHSKIAGAKKVVIPDTSHHLNMEQPKEYNRTVTKFLLSL